jgi:apolipoprotein N-acyltransferase
MRRGAVAVPAVVAGVVAAFSVPPWGWWFLAFPAVGGLAWLLGRLPRARTRALAGLLFGFGLFGPTLFWISEFHAVGYVLLLLLEGSFLAGAGALTPRRYAVVVLPATLVLAEFARGAVPFGGLPMGGIVLGQVSGPLVASARIGGALLLTGVAACVGCACLSVVRREWRVALGLAGVAFVFSALGWVAPDGRVDGHSRIAIVQGGGRRGFRAIDTDPSEVLAAHLRVSEQLRPPLDLVVWPENTIDVSSIDGSPEAEALAAVARRLGATVVAGVTEDAPESRFQNVAVAWNAQGEIVGRYTKAHRVPFGEYVPMRSLLERVVDLSVLPRDAVAGGGPGILHTPAGNLGVAISYEVFFAERGRAAARAGGEVLLVPTNAASFTTSQVPTQEVAAARLRAWETGRWVLQSAPTGYGAVIDARGRVHARTVLGEPGVLHGRPELRTGRTIYVVLGDAPVALLALAVVGGGWWFSRRRSTGSP